MKCVRLQVMAERVRGEGGDEVGCVCRLGGRGNEEMVGM